MTMREECGVPAGAATVVCDGVSLAVSREGAGPPVVCLHAVGHGGGDYATFAAAVRDRHEVIRIDWPGHGRSGADARPPSAERYAELLADVLGQLGIERPVLIGNSIGGAAAMLYASRHPVVALVLCDPGGLVPVNALVRGVAGLFVRFYAAGEQGAGWFEQAFAVLYRRVLLPVPAAAEQRERIIRAGREYAPLLRQAWESFRRPEADLRAIARALNVPMLLAWSRQDRVIPLWLCRPAIRALQQASLTTFRGGHTAFLEDPEHFTPAFLRFMVVVGHDGVPGDQGMPGMSS